MTIRQVWPTSGLPFLGKDVEEEWAAWLTAHGLPTPSDIPLGHPITVDDKSKTIAYSQMLRDQSGSVILEGDGVAIREVVVQLKAPAAPFPPGYPVEEW